MSKRYSLLVLTGFLVIGSLLTSSFLARAQTPSTCTTGFCTSSGSYIIGTSSSDSSNGSTSSTTDSSGSSTLNSTSNSSDTSNQTSNNQVASSTFGNTSSNSINSGTTSSSTNATTNTSGATSVTTNTQPAPFGKILSPVMPQIVQIDTDGNVLIRGRVTAVSSTAITLGTWGGSWTITAIPITTFIPLPGIINGVLGGIQVGDYVGVAGIISETQPLSATATTIRDWTQSPPVAVSRSSSSLNSSTGTTSKVNGTSSSNGTSSGSTPASTSTSVGSTTSNLLQRVGL